MLENYIDKQKDIAAVDLFAEKFQALKSNENQKQFRHLIPESKPGEGQSYAFEVDLDKCSGCKCCVTACHNENGLDEKETWRSVGLIIGGEDGKAALQHITTACHHCLEPGCLTGCPVKAYDKDPETGIVLHLDDQCIGCQYCIFKCPYGAPQYNKRLGIVRKCDMCIGRLKDGEPPACVKGCPTEAIRIICTDNVKNTPDDFVEIQGSPDPMVTFPLTKYRSDKKPDFKMNSADYHSIKSEHSHTPLVFLLVLTQLSVGAFGAEFLCKPFLEGFLGNIFSTFHAVIALGAGLLAIGASIFHLGRPRYAFRAILGLRTSWLSREIVAFGVFAFISAVYAVLSFFVQPGDNFDRMFNILTFTILFSGILAIICSIMVYVDTKRPFWASYITTVKFLITPCILGITTIFLTSMCFLPVSPDPEILKLIRTLGNIFSVCLIIFTVIKLCAESVIFFHLRDKEFTYFKKTAMLMTGELKSTTVSRVIFGVMGGIVFPCIILLIGDHLNISRLLFMAATMFIFTFTGEFLERFLFFKAVIPLKMPGGLIT